MIHPLIYFDMRHDIIVTTTSDQTHVLIAGNLTVRNAVEIVTIFQDIKGENILIELQDPSAIDMSFLRPSFACKDVISFLHKHCRRTDHVLASEGRPRLTTNR